MGKIAWRILVWHEIKELRLVVAGHCNQEIADHLCLSVRTVESRRTLLQKVGTFTLVGLASRRKRRLRSVKA